ncbi:MAG: hypothetical protein HY304_04465 [candidate division Zixibacteria bacterium]|nr:hypothetical protein [candidate division Zixibacteria bacterium]
MVFSGEAVKMLSRWLGGPATRLWAFVTVLTVVAGLTFGCGKLNRGGPGDNSPPEVFLVNIPPDGTEFSASPTVYWYGTDNDGRIVRYDYAVVLASTVDSVAVTLPGDLPPVDKFIAFVLNDRYPRWISVYNDTTHEKVKLFASPFASECDSTTTVIDGDTVTIPVDCVSDTVPQYFFIRGIDDRGASSKVKYRSYKRRNHWPDTSVPEGFNVNGEYLSLPKLSDSYSGVQLFWSGSDRLDFRPPTTPELQFYARVYGPFAFTGPHSRPTIADTLAPNGLPRAPAWQSANRDTLQGVWVSDTTAIIFDLWHQADRNPDANEDSTVTRTGWFMMVVTARDDAFIADETPAAATFKVIYPRFERKVLLVDDTWYGADSYGGPSCDPNSYSPKCNQDFLLRMLKAVYPESDTLLDFWWRSGTPAPYEPCTFDTTRVRCGNSEDLSMLAQHRLVIQISDDIQNPLNATSENPPVQATLMQYLQAGGMVWIIARNGLLVKTRMCDGCNPLLFDFCDPSKDQYDQLACQYFDMEGMWYPAWRHYAIPKNVPGLASVPASNDEFVGASLVTQGTGLPPVLEVDTTRVKNKFMDATVLYSLLNGIAIPGIPDVDFIVRGSKSTPLYTFNSWRPQGPVPPDNGVSFMQGKVIAVRRVGPDRAHPLYKTAYFTFPMYFIKEDQARDVFINMVHWFFLPFSQS